ncbi:MAG TPA: hypothetical protein VF623_01035, partial [Segetibacter sp.]
KLLRKLSHPNEKISPLASQPGHLAPPFRAGAALPAGQNKRSQVRDDAQEKLFPEARNFR